MASTLLAALKITALGLTGVFATLILFYAVTRAMLFVASRLPED